MTARALALLLVVIAASAYVAIALPARRATADLGDDYRRARERRRDATLRLSRIGRQGTVRARAAAPRKASGEDQSAALVALRLSVLESIGTSGASNVRLAVSPGRAPVAASVHLSAQGRFDDLVRLAAAVARPGSGIVLDRVHLAPGADTISLELEALRLEGYP